MTSPRYFASTAFASTAFASTTFASTTFAGTAHTNTALTNTALGYTADVDHRAWRQPHEAIPQGTEEPRQGPPMKTRP